MTTRLASIDLLRTVAIVTMVLVHFTENLSGYTPPFAGLGAPLFVFLSGVSYFLWSNALVARGQADSAIERISVRRGLFIFGAGFAFNLFVWLPEDIFNWDVLTFIGSALVLLAFMALWIWGAGTVGSRLTEMPNWARLIFYVVAGFGWILPLRPLLKWMNANQPPEDD